MNVANLRPMLRYAATTLKHKYFVFVAGLKTGAPLWRLVIHDWSKFTPAEWPAYARHFCGTADRPLELAAAWLHHQNANPHHWEHWVSRTVAGTHGKQEGAPLEMPDELVREMVADWLGASRAYRGKWPTSRASWTWLVETLPRMRLHPVTAWRVTTTLDEYFGGSRINPDKPWPRSAPVGALNLFALDEARRKNITREVIGG